MYQYQTMSGRTRFAIAALYTHMVVKLLFGLVYVYRDAADPSSPSAAGREALFGLSALAYLLVLLTAVIAVGCWIYRANANAHAIGGDLNVRPGWAVGWYFVPIANLFKPFEAMKETWLASHYGGDWGRGTHSDLLHWWWGLWIITGFIDNIAWRVADDTPSFAAGATLVTGVIGVPLSLTLIALIRQISEAQKVTRHTEVFA